MRLDRTTRLGRAAGVSAVAAFLVVGAAFGADALTKQPGSPFAPVLANQSEQTAEANETPDATTGITLTELHDVTTGTSGGSDDVDSTTGSKVEDQQEDSTTGTEVEDHADCTTGTSVVRTDDSQGDQQGGQGEHQVSGRDSQRSGGHAGEGASRSGEDSQQSGGDSQQSGGDDGGDSSGGGD